MLLRCSPRALPYAHGGNRRPVPCWGRVWGRTCPPAGRSCLVQRGPRRLFDSRRNGDAEPEEKDVGDRELKLEQQFAMPSNKLDDKVRQSVTAAIKRGGYRVTVGDVAAAAGVRLSEAEEALKALAADTLAHLEVSEQGDVVYAFNQGFEARLLRRSLLLRARPVWAAIVQWVGYITRIAFGSSLVAGVILVWTTIVLLLTSSSKDERRRGGGGGGFGGGNGMGGLRMAMDLSDLFIYFDPYYWRTRQQRQQAGQSMGFIEAIFSVVFGDGDPNAQFEQQRWQAIGRLIRERGGVVAAEELAPYLDLSVAEVEASEARWRALSRGGGADGGVEGYVDEGYVLPVLVRFGGEPFVDEAGNLLYRFPDLQTSSGSGKGAGIFGRKQSRDDAALARSDGVQEATWALSAATPGQFAGVVALAAANAVGVLVLSSMLADPRQRMTLVQLGLDWVFGLLPALQVYAASFFLIPAVRAAVNARRNAEIEARNAARVRAAQLLQAAYAEALRKGKLASARKAGQVRRVAKEDAVYRTDAEPGSKRGETSELRSWDLKLSESMKRGRQQGDE